MSKSILEELQRKVEALAAENAQMSKLLSDISGNHVEYYSEGECCMFAGVPLDYVSEINAHVARDVNAENPFKATDSALSEIRTRAQLEMCDSLTETFTRLSAPGQPFGAGAAGALAIIEVRAEQLRKEASND